MPETMCIQSLSLQGAKQYTLTLRCHGNKSLREVYALKCDVTERTGKASSELKRTGKAVLQGALEPTRRASRRN